LLDDLRRWFAHLGCLIEAEIAGADIAPDRQAVHWREFTARHLICCEGWMGQRNPWFSWLPFVPLKGEFLSLDNPAGLTVMSGPVTPRGMKHSDSGIPPARAEPCAGGMSEGKAALLPSDASPSLYVASRCFTLTDHILNGAHWLIPRAEGGYRFGATHDHAVCDSVPSPAGRAELEAGFRALLPGREARIAAHQAGVRPGTRDKSPLLGTHPKQPGLHIFNGFGARGALAIPWHAERMADYLLHGATLPAEADIRRIPYPSV
jgi:glycine/D-amino acid oxidase-like deaminating enzyme